MSYGLQVFAPNGTDLRLDINDRTPRLISITAVTTPVGTATSTLSITGADPSTTIVVVDNGAVAVVSASNQVTLYGTATSENTNLKLLAF